MNLDYETLTLAEIETIEEITGLAIDEIVSIKAPKGKLFRALIYVITKRTNPAYTYEETGTLTLADGMAMLPGEDDDDPKGD